MKNILKILRLAKPLYGIVGMSGFLILLVSLTQLSAPLLSKFLVDEVVAQITDGTGDVQTLALLIGIGFGLGLLGIFLTAISERIGDRLTGELRRFLTERFYHKVFTLPQEYFDSQISGKIVHQLNRGILSITDFVNSSTNFILPNFVQIIITLGVLFYYSLSIGLFMAILFPIYTMLSTYSSKRWGVHEVKKNELEDATRGRINEVIGNMKLVKTSLTELSEFRYVSAKLQEINKIYDTQSREFHIFDFYRNLSLQVILLIINIIVFVNTFRGIFSIGEMVLILQLVSMARAPLFAMSYITERIQMAEQGSKEFFTIMDLTSKETPVEKEKMSRVVEPEVQFNNVSFHYEESGTILNKVSFALKNDQTTALVGHSGAGKTTIVNLILKLYEHSSGDITLNGTSYRDLSHAEIRNNISLVFQDNELFSTTIRDNVAYGTKADEKAVIQALKQANAWDFVKKLPQGINSEIGERGVKLSGGQKQRIQIARAILKDSPILILDEATSSLDAKSEKEVQEALEKLFHNRLVLIIAHRFSTIQNADTIIVLDQGKIADYGTPGELARKPGIYSDLLQYQVEGNAKLLKQYELF